MFKGLKVHKVSITNFGTRSHALLFELIRHFLLIATKSIQLNEVQESSGGRAKYSLKILYQDMPG